MGIKEQIEWWRRQDRKGCVPDCPYWSELEGFLYTVEALNKVYLAAKEYSEADGSITILKLDAAIEELEGK